MKYTFTQKKVKITDDLRAYAEKKVGKLDRFFRGESEAFITFSSERSRYQVELTISNGGMNYRVSEVTSDMFASIDSAVAAIERQIRKNKTRLEKRLRDGTIDWGTSFESDDDLPEDEDEFKIVKSKRFSIKPMAAQEAILQMNLLNHEFFVFKNNDNDDNFAVVYKRKDGNYGLIEGD